MNHLHVINIELLLSPFVLDNKGSKSVTQSSMKEFIAFVVVLQHTGTEHKFDIRIERPPSKPDVLDELISILQKFMDFCVCCITCGCYKRQKDGIVTDEYGMILLDNEKQAVQNLLQYLEKGTIGTCICIIHAYKFRASLFI